MPYVVNLQMTVDTEDPDEAIAFVRAELAMKLGEGGDQLWQTARPDLLPRWQVSSTRRATRLDQTGAEVE